VACGPELRIARPGARPRVEVVGDLVDEPDPQRRLGAEALARDEERPRRAGADRANTNGEMTAGMIPSRTSLKPKVASGAATATSAHATRPEPPPSA
jgi:hypothetical protein